METLQAMNPISSSHMIQFKTYSFPFFPLRNVKKTGYISLQEEVSRKTRMLHNTVLKKGANTSYVVYQSKGHMVSTRHLQPEGLKVCLDTV